MKTKKSKFKRISVVMAICILMSAFMVFPAQAANTKDTTYNFNIDEYSMSNNNNNTYTRAKQNSSSVYVRANAIPSGSNGLWIITYGFIPTGSYGNLVVQNKTKNGYAIIGYGSHEIYNSIYEAGGRSAYINVSSPNNARGVATGAWSPDCAGSYPVANP